LQQPGKGGIYLSRPRYTCPLISTVLGSRSASSAFRASLLLFFPPANATVASLPSPIRLPRPDRPRPGPSAASAHLISLCVTEGPRPTEVSLFATAASLPRRRAATQPQPTGWLPSVGCGWACRHSGVGQPGWRHSGGRRLAALWRAAPRGCCNFSQRPPPLRPSFPPMPGAHRQEHTGCTTAVWQRTHRCGCSTPPRRQHAAGDATQPLQPLRCTISAAAPAAAAPKNLPWRTPLSVLPSPCRAGQPPPAAGAAHTRALSHPHPTPAAAPGAQGPPHLPLLHPSINA